MRHSVDIFFTAEDVTHLRSRFLLTWYLNVKLAEFPFKILSGDNSKFSQFGTKFFYIWAEKTEKMLFQYNIFSDSHTPAEKMHPCTYPTENIHQHERTSSHLETRSALMWQDDKTLVSL